MIETKIVELYNSDLEDHFTAYKDLCNTDIDDNNKLKLLTAEKRRCEEMSVNNDNLENSGDYQLRQSDKRAWKQTRMQSPEYTSAITRSSRKGKGIEKSAPGSLMMTTSMKKLKIERHICEMRNHPTWTLEAIMKNTHTQITFIQLLDIALRVWASVAKSLQL